MKKTLTVEVDEELHQKVGVHARMNKITITKYITDLITKDLQKHSTPAKNGNLNTSLDEACKVEIKD